MDMDDMMSAFFGSGGMGGMGGMGGPRRRRGKDIGLALPVSLEDLYTGKVVELPREKVVLCSACRGSGSKGGQRPACQDCRGQGARIMMRQVGPGMMQRMQVPCETCRGQGSIINPKDVCKTCNGERTKTMDSPLRVDVQKGMEHEQQIPFMGEGDQHPDIETPGHIVVVLQQKDHPVFTREENDLLIKKRLTLAQALCGFSFTITHLDKRVLVVQSEPGQIIKPRDRKVILDEGMPVFGSAKKGDLVIEFDVDFPSRIEESVMPQLRAALPPGAARASTADAAAAGAEECYLSPRPLDEVRKELEAQADDDDDERGGGGPAGVQCAQQ